MTVDWSRIPDWIDWVAPESNEVGVDRCYGWSAKPYIEECPNRLEFTNWYCTDDDGIFCELPHDVARREDSDLLDFKNSLVNRNNNHETNPNTPNDQN